MALKTEQIDIQDWLKYFVARNEFDRKSILEVISDLTLSELADLKLTSQKDLATIYDEIKRQITELIENANNREVIINDGNLNPDAFYYETFILNKPFQIILDKRNVEYSLYDNYENLYKIVKDTNPPTGKIIAYDEDINSIDELLADNVYLSDTVLIKLILKEILNNRNVNYSSQSTIQELLDLVIYTNPILIHTALNQNFYLESDISYTDDFLRRFGFEAVLSLRGISYNEDEPTEDLILKVMRSQAPNEPEVKNELPLNNTSWYEINFLEKYAYIELLKKRGFSELTYEEDLDNLKRMVDDTNPDTEGFLSLKELTKAINGDVDFYNTVLRLIRESQLDINIIYSYVDNKDDVLRTELTNKIILENTTTRNEINRYISDVVEASIQTINDNIDILEAVIETNNENLETNIASSLVESKSYTDTKCAELDLKIITGDNVFNSYYNDTFIPFKDMVNGSLTYLNFLVSSFVETSLDGRFMVKRGTANFTGNNRSVKITHNLGQKPTAFLMHSIINTAGGLGEVYATIDDLEVNIYNSGSTLTEFNWTIIMARADTDASDYIKTGKARFSGNSIATTVPHGLGRIPDVVDILPTENPSGDLGEYWYRVDANNLYFYNTGDATTEFTWTAINGAEDDSVVRGTSKFNGNNTPVYIPHGLGKIPLVYTIIPSNTTGSVIGELYINADETNIIVYNTGRGTSNFDYMIWDIALSEQQEKYLKYAENGMTNINGFWDNSEEEPTGNKRLNYSGELHVSKSRITMGNCISIPLTISNPSTIVQGDIIGVVNGSLAKVTTTATNYLGVCARDYGQLLGRFNPSTEIPLGVTGVTKVKCSGSISVGDLLTVSNGTAIKANVTTDIGKIIGRALDSHSGTTVDLIDMLIQPM